MARVGRQTKTREYKDLEAHFTANLGYSHHQKAVILDAPVKSGQNFQKEPKPNGSVFTVREKEDTRPKTQTAFNDLGSSPENIGRRIIAYVGGIDLTGNLI